MTVVTRTEASDDLVTKIEALYAQPGEKVKFTSIDQFTNVSPERLAKWKSELAERELTVKNVIYTEDHQLRYAFEGISGEYNVGLFENIEGYEHDLYVFVTRDGQTWATPIKSNGAGDITEASGEPRKIARVLDRSARWGMGVPENEVDSLFEEWENSPVMGEFSIAPLPDGFHKIIAVSWHARASSDELRAVEHALIPTTPTP